ncbi:MAG TPA: diguanylate cyclase [Bryobacteraceae bacterium]|nr:diguanylate cyclase [Bryobacteraceae bacterium]
MADDSHLHALHAAVNCYLSTLGAMGDCAAAACPEIGGIYKHRLSRLRARLAFDSSTEAMEESCTAIEAALVEYAERASGYIARHRTELRGALAALQDLLKSFAQRQDFYAARLRQFAAQMEATRYPTEPEPLQEVVALQVIGLLSCVESMAHETQSLVARMNGELDAVEVRVKDAEVTDPLTGLMNRREMERQIEAHKAAGHVPVLLLFELTGTVNDEVMQQVAARLGSHFRHKDFICRWTTTEFLVLFQGPPEIAQMRAEQIVPWVAGRYLLANGENVEVGLDARLTEPEVVA